jgi:ABC-type nickel/cobalt efflux system permease component RcnA
LRRAALIVGVVLLAVLGAVVIVRARSSVDGVASARRVLQKDGRFVNGPAAGNAFADVSHLLLNDAKSCAHRHATSDRRCSARFSAAAYTSVAAFSLLGCTAPGVYEARRSVLSELDGIVLVDRAGGRMAPPRIPDVPKC